MSIWQPIESAPRDGTPIWLRFRAGYARSNKGSTKHRVWMPEREIVGRWWTLEDAKKRVGERSLDNARGRLIRSLGGYWGHRKGSRPMAGTPIGWRPVEAGEKTTSGTRPPP